MADTPPKRRFAKRWIGRLALIGMSFVFAGIGGEIFVRLLIPAPGNQGDVLEHDDMLGWRKKPGSVETVRTDEYQVDLRLNERGLRGPDYPYEKPADTYRVLVLGDSFVEGYTVPIEQLFTTLLEEQLGAASGRAVQVVNAGTRGYSTDQELLFFTEEGHRYQPDLTVLMFYDNDLLYNGLPRYWRGNKPQFVVGGGGGELQLTNVPVVPSDPDGTAEDVGGLKGFLARNSRLYLFVRESLKQNLALHGFLVDLGLMSGGDEGAGEDPDDPLGLVPQEFHAYARDELSDHMQLCWQVTAGLLERLRAETRAAGSDLLVFHIPPKFAVGHDDRTAFQEQFEGLLDPERVNRELERICSDQGLEFVNPLEDFRRAAESAPEPLYFERDAHWNAAGNALAARLLDEAIRASFLK